MDNTLPRPRWWRRFPGRLSVRALMLLVLAIAVGLGWAARRARVQREAVAAIERAGGSVVYAYDWRDGTRVPSRENPRSRWPRWLIDALGPDYFDGVAMVSLINKADDALLVHVGRLDRLDTLDLSGSRAVTDEGLAHLRGLTNLTHLSLSATRTTDAGLAQIGGLTRMKSLMLDNSRVTDKGLAHLRRMDGLTWLYLGRTGVTDAGLATIAGHAQLFTLSLDNTSVGDDGLSHLGSLDGLNSLSLRGTHITDAGLPRLEALKSCEEVTVGKTAVTAAGIQSARQRRPRTSIIP